ncbi:phosphate/phosphite/phosphonate ABC transporter substrate-binding protein [Alkalicoccus urumqiensis]|uniref:Phosphate/phosphite/phosphonate ABC transporter substrate-binding protein n=1 Tax=Alkalicoccus urumqiensis TaxID=1548213 RepID=A0A2P6MEZ3_ALKUR|nr:phosphate/phosphite/phosphonate ABC transporter substrate-binding protein [Alkalicoccus urumqiensis]PRO64833.1 phosphate/phosphite/phosphonate ABC transporter substrate-binding protein [Alkalicoccus urumqiensis]
MNWKTAAVTAGGMLVLAGCGTDNTEENEAGGSNAGENTGGNNSSDDVFEVAVIPSQSVGEMQDGLTALEEHLAAEMDQEVEVEHYPSYNAVVEAINYGHVDLAYFGPTTYLIAHETSGAEAVITQNVNGEPYYYSYMITQPDAPWDDLDSLIDDAENIDFAFGSQSSTSGFVIPGYELKQQGVYENEGEYEFNSVRFTGSHDITATVVAEGDVDAGAIDSAIFTQLIDEGMINEDDYKIIWESDQLYQYPWAVPEGTSDEEKDAVREAFLSIEDEEILSIFGGADSFVEASHDEYESIMDAARSFDLLDPESLED